MKTRKKVDNINLTLIQVFKDKSNHRIKPDGCRYLYNTQQHGSWNVNAVVYNSNMVLSPEDCATFARAGQGRCQQQQAPRPPADPTAGSRWNVGRTVPCHPDPPWSSTHQPTINQPQNSKRPIPLHDPHLLSSYFSHV